MVHAAQPGGRPGWRRHALPIAGAVVILLVVAAYLGTRSGLGRPPRAQRGDAPAPGAIRSIAVLPLDNYSGDAGQDYFAEGMTDELTAQLATISQLRVISRGSAMQFKGAHRPPTPEIARTLDVDAIVEGSVLRSGERVRITAQLIDARADRHLWARSFERSSRDVLALQDELASAIAREIHAELTPAEQSRLASAPRIDPEAYDAYLKGRYFFNRPSDENLQKAIARFEEAIALEPAFAPAHSGLSDAYLWAGYNEGFLTASEARPKAKAAAEKAIQLDDASAEAHTSLANFKLWYEYDWQGCEAEFRRALALNPSYAYAHDQFGMALAFQGRLEEAIAEGRRAAELDPLSPQILLDATLAFAWKGELRGGAPAREEGIGPRPDLLHGSLDRRVDRDPGRKGRGCRRAVPEGRGHGVTGVRLGVARLCPGGLERSNPRRRRARRAEEEVAARLSDLVRPRARSSRPGRSRTGPERPGTGLRDRLAVARVARDGPDVRPAPLGASLHGAPPEAGPRPGARGERR